MTVQITANPHHGTRAEAGRPMLELFAPERTEEVAAFHRSIPGYAPTRLVELPHLAHRLGVGRVLVKDESTRFGLNAFKVLGGSFAIGRHLARILGVDIAELPYSRMTAPEVREALGEVTFVTATDGNHGRGVAWTAQRLGQRCVVHMPRSTAPERLERIRALGAEADITDLNYDDAVRLAAREAEENGWVLVQDTSWPGYEEIPRDIIRGYGTMLTETLEQLEEIRARPTHVLVQAGVGALATAVVASVLQHWGGSAEGGPVIAVVEPDHAACLYQTLGSADGQLHPVAGDLQTIMAGLAGGEPVTVGADVLFHGVDAAASVPDWVAAQGKRVLSSPLGPEDQGAAGAESQGAAAPGPDQATASAGTDPADTDPRIVSGESGAAPLGLVHEVLTDPELAPIAQRLGLGPDSTVLVFSTEGDTDRAGYEAVVHDGAHARPAR